MNDFGQGGGNDGVRRFYGKFRGTVINNIDPEQRGRIMAMVPDVLGVTPSSWALPCVPLAGKNQGTFMVPQTGAAVWIEFEQGDPDYPIWTGGFWGAQSEVPQFATAPPPITPGQNIVLQTTGQAAVVISDASPSTTGGGVVLRSSGGSTVVVNDSGIYLRTSAGAEVKLVGTSVDINNGALKVT